MDMMTFLLCCHPRTGVLLIAVCNASATHFRSSGQASPQKNQVTSKSPIGDTSVATLIGTDTALGHGQKAEKAWADRRRLLRQVLVQDDSNECNCQQVVCVCDTVDTISFLSLSLSLSLFLARSVVLSLSLPFPSQYVHLSVCMRVSLSVPVIMYMGHANLCRRLPRTHWV